MTIWKYLTFRFLSRVMFVSLGLLLLVILLTMIENMRRASNGGEGAGFALQLTLLQAPAFLSQVSPLIFMLAALWTFLGLSRSSELVVLRAAGVSATRFLFFPVVSAFLIGVLFITVISPIVAATSQRATAMIDELSRGGSNVLSLSGDALWLRQGTPDGQTVIEAKRVSADGTTLFGVRMHHFNTQNILVTRIEARSASLVQSQWVLRGVSRWTINDPTDPSLGKAEQLPELTISTNLSQERILDSFAAPETVSIWELQEFIQTLERAGFSARRHRIFLQTELARPALYAAMVLIGAAFSLRHMRFGQTGVMVLMAIFSGFLLYFFKDLTESLGNAGTIPVILAGWTPPIVAILLASSMLLHLEDG